MRERLVRLVLPDVLRRWWRRAGGVDMGDLRSLEPLSRVFGEDRGQPVCRWYIEKFLDAHRDLVRGRVLEVAERTYTRRFGGAQVTESVVMHATGDNAEATIVGDLATGRGIPEGRFDAAILTQTLQCVFDLPGAARTIHRLLAPGGAALVTVPAIAQASRYDAERWGEFWRFTPQAISRLFDPVFGAANVRVAPHGNAIAAHAYLAGMAAEELREAELAANDPDYPIIVTAVVVKRF